MVITFVSLKKTIQSIFLINKTKKFVIKIIFKSKNTPSNKELSDYFLLIGR